jgi:hypothetical protein
MTDSPAARRVGENGQSKLEGPVALDAAVKIFEGKFKSKTGYKWDGAAADYPGGKAKKYTVIFEKHDGGGAQASALEAAAGGTPVKAREKEIGGSGGSLEPPGPLLTPLHTVYGVFCVPPPA